jgi:hypothetical protein
MKSMSTSAIPRQQVVACLQYAISATRARSSTWEAAVENCVPLLDQAAREASSARPRAASAVLKTALVARGPDRERQILSALEMCVRELLYPEA